MTTRKFPSTAPGFLAGGALLLALLMISRHNFLLFHTLVEMFSVVVACSIFMIAWNARQFATSGYLLFFGITALFIGLLDLLHTMAYKGMGVFPQGGANLPTQLWIAARGMQGVALFLAPFFIDRKVRPAVAIAGVGAVTALLLTAIFTGVFPDGYVEGVGLTPFKKWSEYVICLVLCAALALLVRRREAFHRRVFHSLLVAILLTIGSELAFTAYVSVYGSSNMVGHLFKLFAFYLFYKGIVATGLAEPYNLLFRELKESEEKFSRAFRGAPVALTITEPASGRFINVNESYERLFGFSSGETIGRTSLELGIWVDLADRQRLRDELDKKGGVRGLELRLRHKSGAGLFGLVAVEKITVRGGEYLLSMVLDITAQKRAQLEIEQLNVALAERAGRMDELNRELAAANEELGVTVRKLETTNEELEAFNYTVSHDLRAPLTNINGCSQIALDLYGQQLEPQCRDFFQDIHRETVRMDHLISTLLDFAMVSRTPLDLQVVNLSKIAQAIVLDLRQRDQSRTMEYAIENGVTVNGDGKLLHVVLDNLLGNAWKYTAREERAVIEFGRTVQDGEPVLFVRDNGTGFDMARADRLFESFQRLHSDEEYSGHGIGLATVRRIVARHGGRVWAEGSPGKGATFFFTIPTANPTPFSR